MIGRLAHRSFFAWRICERPFAACEAPPAPHGMTVHRLQEDEVLAHFGTGALPLDAAKVRASLARGELCVGALDGRSLVGYAWFAFQAAPHVGGLWMDFNRRYVYVYRAFVHPAYRGRGIAPALYSHADPAFGEQGRDGALLCIAMGNHASLAAARRSGARVAGYCAYLQAGPVFLHARTSGAKRLGYRFYRPG